jgi:hypothetical protein
MLLLADTTAESGISVKFDDAIFPDLRIAGWL